MGSLNKQSAKHCNAELVCDMLRNMEPRQFDMQLYKLSAYKTAIAASWKLLQVRMLVSLFCLVLDYAQTLTLSKVVTQLIQE